MKSEKENTRNRVKQIKTLLGNLGEGDNSHKQTINGKSNSSKKEDHEIVINKEIIRRLRIQNKKLLEQVIKLKEEIKKTKMNKTQVLNQINELLILINC